MLQSLFNKDFFLKTPTQAFSCKICEIFKDTFSYRTPLVAASEEYRIRFKTLFDNLFYHFEKA